MKSRIELLEIKAEELRSKLDTVDGEELKALDEELAIVQDQITQEVSSLQNEASYEDYLDYLGGLITLNSLYIYLDLQ